MSGPKPGMGSQEAPPAGSQPSHPQPPPPPPPHAPTPAGKPHGSPLPSNLAFEYELFTCAYSQANQLPHKACEFPLLASGANEADLAHGGKRIAIWLWQLHSQQLRSATCCCVCCVPLRITTSAPPRRPPPPHTHTASNNKPCNEPTPATYCFYSSYHAFRGRTKTNRWTNGQHAGDRPDEWATRAQATSPEHGRSCIFTLYLYLDCTLPRLSRRGYCSGLQAPCL